MKKLWWGIFFGALIGTVFFLPDTNFANRVREAVLINLPLLLVALGGFYTLYFKPYIHKKAENLATKEDIGVITREVEQVKIEFDKEREEHRTRNVLRMAVFEQRFRAHQEAHTLWFKLYQNVHRDECNKVVIECQEWWMNNSLYLDAKAREAFNRAYMSANNHSAFLADRRNGELVERNWEDIVQAGTAIAQSVGLPPIAADTPDAPQQPPH